MFVFLSFFLSLSPSFLRLHFRLNFWVASLSPRSFLSPHIFFHCHHLMLWFLFFIFVASCNYALVFIKLRNRGLRVSFLFLFVLSPSSFPHALVFVLICNLFPLQCAFVFIFITFSLCLGVHLHLHRVQVWILRCVFGLYYLCSTISILLFVLLCLHFVLLFVFCRLLCILLLCIFFLHFFALCWSVLFFAIYSSHFVLCWNTSRFGVLALLKHFSFWCSYCIEVFFTLVFLLCWSIFRSSVLTLLKHFTLWCSCFVLCKVFCCNIFHFSVRASRFALQCISIFKCLAAFRYVFLPFFFFVFIYMSLFVHFFYGFFFLVMFIGNGRFA